MHRGVESLFGNTDVVVLLIEIPHTCQNSEGLLGGWFLDDYRAQAALHCGIFFNQAVLLRGGGANTAQSTTGQGRL